MTDNFNQREAARQELRKQQELSSQENTSIRFNAAWHRKQVLTVRSVALPIALMPWSTDEPLFTFYKSKFVHKSHTRTSLCTCHDGTLPAPCVACHYAVKWNRPDMLPHRLSAISVVILKHFHKVVETVGNYKATRYYLCKESDCKYCDQNTPREFGLRRYLELTEDNQESLLRTIDEVAGRCASCLKGSLYTDDYQCPECSGPFEVEGDVADILSSEVECPHCGAIVYPDLSYACDTCSNPAHGVDPFDFVYEVKLDPQELGKYSFQVVDGESKQDVLKDTSVYKRAPLPFSLFLLSQPLSEQAKALAMTNPFNAQDQKCLDDAMANLVIQANHSFVEEY